MHAAFLCVPPFYAFRILGLTTYRLELAHV